MKLIIDIPDEEYNRIKEWEDNITGYQTSLVLYRAVRNGIPYEERPEGDSISRKYLKEQIPELWSHDDAIDIWIKRFDVEDLIDNAPPAEPEKVLFANVTFDEDKLKEIVQTEVIEKIKSGELVIKDERPQGDLKSVEALKAYAREVLCGNNPTNSLLIRMFDEIIDNAQPASDRYDEGYAQGYIDGSTGADWKGGAV